MAIKVWYRVQFIEAESFLYLLKIILNHCITIDKRAEMKVNSWAIKIINAGSDIFAMKFNGNVSNSINACVAFSKVEWQFS